MSEKMNDTEILEKFALRSNWGTSDVIPLATVDGRELDPDRFWIVFKEANAEKISQLSKNMARTISREEANGEMVQETEFDPYRMVKALVDLQLIDDAQFPVQDSETGELSVQEWSRQKHEQRKILDQLQPGLMGIIHRHLVDFYFSDEEEELVDEAKNSSES